MPLPAEPVPAPRAGSLGTEGVCMWFLESAPSLGKIPYFVGDGWHPKAQTKASFFSLMAGLPQGEALGGETVGSTLPPPGKHP